MIKVDLSLGNFLLNTVNIDFDYIDNDIGDKVMMMKFDLSFRNLLPETPNCVFVLCLPKSHLMIIMIIMLIMTVANN